MTDAGEVAADIGLEYVVHLLGHDLQAQRLQSVVRVAPRSKAVTAVKEIRFKHCLDNARYRSLQQPIRDRGARSGSGSSTGISANPARERPVARTSRGWSATWRWPKSERSSPWKPRGWRDRTRIGIACSSCAPSPARS